MENILPLCNIILEYVADFEIEKSYEPVNKTHIGVCHSIYLSQKIPFWFGSEVRDDSGKIIGTNYVTYHNIDKSAIKDLLCPELLKLKISAIDNIPIL